MHTGYEKFLYHFCKKIPENRPLRLSKRWGEYNIKMFLGGIWSKGAGCIELAYDTFRILWARVDPSGSIKHFLTLFRKKSDGLIIIGENLLNEKRIPFFSVFNSLHAEYVPPIYGKETGLYIK
jgi:hypothetical protein